MIDFFGIVGIIIFLFGIVAIIFFFLENSIAFLGIGITAVLAGFALFYVGMKRRVSYRSAESAYSIAYPKPSMPSLEPVKEAKKKEKLREEERLDDKPMESEEEAEMALPSRPTAGTKPSSPSTGIEDRSPFERKASLIYWERMCLEKEFDLIVSIHKTEVKIEAIEDATVKTTKTMKIPREGYVRVTPISTACNVAPAYRDIKVSEFKKEQRTEFKVLPTQTGKHNLSVEIQYHGPDGETENLSEETVRIVVQDKPLEYQLDGLMTLKVSNKFPAILSIFGAFFGFLSFVLAQFGVDLEEELFNAIGAISTALLAVVLILFAIILFWNGIKITKKEIEINFDTRRFSSILSAKT